MSIETQTPSAQDAGAFRKPPSTIFDVIGVLRRRWKLIALLALVGAIVAIAYTVRQEKVYEADATTLVQRQSLAKSLNNIVDPGAQVNEGPRVLEAQAQLAMSPEVAQATLRAVPNTGLTVNDLLANVTVTPDVNGDLLAFALTNGDGDTAVKLVNVYVDEYVKYSTKIAKASALEAAAEVRKQLRQLERDGERDSQAYQRLSGNLDSLRSIISLSTPTAQVIAKATGYTKVKPKMLIALVLGTFLGLVIGIGLAFLLDALDGRVRSPEAIADYLGLPLLAVMPSGRRGPGSGGRSDDSEEACRVLLAALGGSSRSSSGSLLVTGVANPSTYSSIAANLAHTSARSGRDTVLVDLGFRNASLTRLMGVQGQLGVTDVLLGDASITDASVPISPGDGDAADIAGRLRFMPIGVEANGSSADLIGSLAVKDLIERLSTGDTLVIVDTGATLDASEAISAADFVENVLFVAATDTARQDALADARRRLDLATAKPIGVAVIEVPE